MEGFGVYLTRLFDAWQGLAAPGKLPLRFGFFLLLLAITVWCRGRRSWTARATIGVIATITLVHLNFLVMPFLYLLTEAFERFYTSLGIPRLPASTWASVPAFLVALVAVFAHDVANYWNHRLMHGRLFWPIHAIHHSDPDVNPLTSLRVHAFEAAVMIASYILLLSWLNVPPEAIGILGVFQTLHNMYVHADLDWTHGPFEMVIASPRLHRWHHADVPEAYGKNLANVFPFLDKLFGTYYCPGPCEAPVGAQGVPEHNPFALFLYPLVAWARMAAAGVQRLTAALQAAAHGAADAVAALHARVTTHP